MAQQNPCSRVRNCQRGGEGGYGFRLRLQEPMGWAEKILGLKSRSDSRRLDVASAVVPGSVAKGNLKFL